jgi:hypothetical protein
VQPEGEALSGKAKKILKKYLKSPYLGEKSQIDI